MAAGSDSSINSQLALFYIAAMATLVAQTTFAIATPDLLPQLCDSIHCPPLEQIVCPPDSELRESWLPAAPPPLPPAALMMPPQSGKSNYIDADIDTEQRRSLHSSNNNNNNHTNEDELYAQCCLAQKCLCRTCYIPDCQKEFDGVLYELTAESMQTPGKCCGRYECRAEPKCGDIHNTQNYWLTNCQRCRCYGGERICHQSCDDEGVKKSTAICRSKALNRFFANGETWKHGCYECECVNGEEKCLMPLCRSVNCPQERQVQPKNSCCPICWPANITMPDVHETAYDEEEPMLPLPDVASYDDDEDDDDGDDDDGDDADDDIERSPKASDYAENQELDVLPNVLLNSVEQNEGTSSTTTGATTKSIPSTSTGTNVHTLEMISANTTVSTPPHHDSQTNPTTAPCPASPQPKAPTATTYQLYPEVVEVVRQTQHSDLLYAVIGCLALAVVLLAAWNIQLRAKQRSYRPVSNFDDNLNKMSPNIKKMNEYV